MWKFYAILCCIVLAACTSSSTQSHFTPEGKADVQTFYYPYDSLETQGQVYAYRDPKGKMPPYYMYLQVVKDAPGNRYLVTTRYNERFEQTQIVRERIASNGTLIEDYRLFYTDSLGQTQLRSEVDLLEKVYFAWTPDTAAHIGYRLKLKFTLADEAHENTYTFTRDRHFKAFNTYKYKNQNIETVQFRNLEFLEIDAADGGNWTLDSTLVNETYAHRIGLVHTERVKSFDNRRESTAFELYDRFSMEDLIALRDAQSAKE